MSPATEVTEEPPPLEISRNGADEKVDPSAIELTLITNDTNKNHAQNSQDNGQSEERKKAVCLCKTGEYIILPYHVYANADFL